MINEKLLKLKKILQKIGPVLIAYSGGVDSTFLLRVAKDVLKSNVLAVTADSATYPRSEVRESQRFAKKFGVRHIIIHTNEMSDSRFRKNPVNRCFYCKDELFGELVKIAKKNKINYVCDGTNQDDFSDYRPGRKAARKWNIRSPLAEAGLTKNDIRKFSQKLKLPTWNKPAYACLASRVPYGTKIEPKILSRIEQAEEYLHQLGLKQVRVRNHQNIARIETSEKEISIIIKNRTKITAKLKSLGYTYITLDLQGYRTGSMNETINVNTDAVVQSQAMASDD